MSEQERVQIYIKYKETWFVTRDTAKCFVFGFYYFISNPMRRSGQTAKVPFVSLGVHCLVQRYIDMIGTYLLRMYLSIYLVASYLSRR